ncbi:MAG: prepilin-type N-terminal cleavage/methylation domain-containing protein [Paraglaciecola polaris]|uniref:prepilin-type N-terminal cleavage/methylation domain-containing protein n=1 Tax=Paraglaciecola polaris TaxID=222814 RepID=UPI003002022A
MKIQSGFSLLEVLIATAIMLFGIAGYVQLQSHYIKLDHTLNLRQQALTLATKKLDDLNSFSVLQRSAGQISYQDISSDTGGLIAAGEISVNLWREQTQTIPFDLHWRVTNMYFVDTDNDDEADTWLPEGNANLPETLPAIAPKKTLLISVSWQDQFGEALEVTLSSQLTPVPFARSAQAANMNLGSDTPLRVIYQPPIDDIDVLHNVSSTQAIQGRAPIIDAVGENITVEIEQTRFEITIPEYEKTNIENQLIVNCNCRLAEPGLGKTPAMTIIESQGLVTKLGQNVIKGRGTAANAQHFQCDQCCNNHHDNPDSVATQNYYRLENGAAHHHYKRLGENSFQEATLAGDEYQEVCRFKQVDGFYHLAADWELLSITEFEIRHLHLENNQNAYTHFIMQRLKAYIQGNGVLPQLGGRDIQLPTGQFQMVGRALYMERLYRHDTEYLNEIIIDGDENWLARVPFYDVNVTLVANWHSSDVQTVNILQQAIQTVENVEQDYYASYQRGVIETLMLGRSRIHASMSGSNSGVVGHSPLSPFEASRTTDGSGIEVNVQP